MAIGAYIYQADIYCEDCGNDLKAKFGPVKFPSEDSDEYPQGPFCDGGGEADCPQHCASCGMFLQNPLTPDGDNYVQEKAKDYENRTDMSWDEIATEAESTYPILAMWIRYYYAIGQ